MAYSLETRAKVVCLYAGACWGLFWIPLRALGDAGLHQLWTTVVYYLVPTVLLLPLLIWRWRSFREGGAGLQLTVMISGLALTLYGASIVYTDVVRAILLFYLLPIWSTIMARIVLGEPITRLRIVALLLAFAGMLTIFGLGLNFPLPRNVGDWMGLGAGFCWAAAMVRLRCDPERSSVDLTIGFFIWALLFSTVVALLLAPAEIRDVGAASPAMPMVLGFVLLVVLPGTYASLWSPKFLDPGIVGLLFMSELVVGAISAAWLSGEPFGTRELIGVVLIAGASLIEPLASVMRRRHEV